MSTLRATRKQDEVAEKSPGPGRLDHSFFWGEFQNTDANARGIVRVVFSDKDGALTMRAFGAGEAGEIDWGEVNARAFADDVGSSEGTKFAAEYNFDFMRIRMHGWVKLGVLVISVFNDFTDNSGRSSYFDREFFFSVPAEAR